MIAITSTTELPTQSSPHELPLLPLVIAGIPATLVEVLQQSGVPVVRFSPERAEGRFVLFDWRHGPRVPLHSGQEAVDLAALSESFDGLIRDLDDERCERREWLIESLPVRENVARVERGPARRRVLDLLRREVLRRGGIWLTLAPVPWPYRTLFNFRADHDAYIPDDFARFMESIAGHEHCVSHFVCGGGFADHPQALERLRGCDAGSHGYWHHTYRDENENRCNILRGIAALQRSGIEPSGFVAPHGRWNRGLQYVLNELQITHSGEFGRAFDDWPFYPCGSRALQIPVHPICLGIALEALTDARRHDPVAREQVADAVAEHFVHWACRQHAADEPIVLYGHPDGRLGRYPHVVKHLLRAIDALPAIWRTTQSEIARWWQARHQIKIRAGGMGDRVWIECDQPPLAYVAAIDLFRGERVARVPLDERRLFIACDSLDFQPRLEPATIASRPARETPTLRSRVKNWLDWEKATPLDEINTSTWRGWLKREIRHRVSV